MFWFRTVLTLCLLGFSGCGDSAPAPAAPQAAKGASEVNDAATTPVASATTTPATGEGTVAPSTPTTPTGDPAWVAEAVADALQFELFPGITDETQNDIRASELRAFFHAHPEYSNPDLRMELAKDACNGGTEAAHERRVSPPPKQTLKVELSRPEEVVVVIHADRLCTSDDWAYYTNEVQEALDSQGIHHASAGADHDTVVLVHEGVEVRKEPLKDQGYLVLQHGKSAKNVEHNLGEVVLTEIKALLTP